MISQKILNQSFFFIVSIASLPSIYTVSWIKRRISIEAKLFFESKIWSRNSWMIQGGTDDQFFFIISIVDAVIHQTIFFNVIICFRLTPKILYGKVYDFCEKYFLLTSTEAVWRRVEIDQLWEDVYQLRLR